MAVIVDARGKACPQPVIETKKALKNSQGEALEIWVDNAIAVQNLTKLASYEKRLSRSEKVDEKFYKVWFESNGEDAADRPEEVTGSEEAVCLPDMRQKKTVVVLKSGQMGEGDPVLGALLMKGFVYALTQLETLPGTILLYNGGAKLSVEGSDSLEDLKLLESQGVEILTCGTCLNHYGLSEKLAVGNVTNMYEIAEKMTQADKLVMP
ncbi:MAG: sulfurtransferase-like selenium metabolism protein YedF [Lachnospiraceae bacterium]